MAYSITQPKTIFELLGLPATATRAEVVTAYQALCRHFESGTHGLSPTLAEYKLASLRSAMEAYSAGDMGTETGGSRAPSIMVASPPVIWSEIDGESPLWAKRRKKFAIMSSWTSTGLRFLLGFIGIVFMFKMIFSYTAIQATNGAPGSMDVMSKATEEKVIIQEYFQETGYLASSRSEVEALRAEEKRMEDERRIELQAQREAEAQQREYERFVEDSRRQGAAISYQLQQQEAQQQQIEAHQREQEELQRRYEEQERVRLERERINAERRRLGMTPVY
jgi:flagellar biosynthesis GTPase FlhF